MPGDPADIPVPMSQHAKLRSLPLIDLILKRSRNSERASAVVMSILVTLVDLHLKRFSTDSTQYYLDRASALRRRGYMMSHSPSWYMRVMMGCAMLSSSFLLSSNSSTSASWLLSSQEMASSTAFSIFSLSSWDSLSATCADEKHSQQLSNSSTTCCPARGWPSGLPGPSFPYFSC